MKRLFALAVSILIISACASAPTTSAPAAPAPTSAVANTVPPSEAPSAAPAQTSTDPAATTTTNPKSNWDIPHPEFSDCHSNAGYTFLSPSANNSTGCLVPFTGNVTVTFEDPNGKQQSITINGTEISGFDGLNKNIQVTITGNALWVTTIAGHYKIYVK